MRPPKRLGRFVLLFVAAYAMLMAPWPGLDRGYARYFRGLGNVAFSDTFWFWPAARVHFLDLHSSDPIGDLNRILPGKVGPGFEPLPPDRVKDTLMVLLNRDAPGSIGQLRTSSRYVGYGPTVMIITLLLATPLALRRKGWALVLGLVLIHLFVLFRLTLTITAGGFAADKAYAILHLGAFWTGVLTRAESLFSDNPTVSFVVPIVVWFLVTLRRSTPDDRDAAETGGAAKL